MYIYTTVADTDCKISDVDSKRKIFYHFVWLSGFSRTGMEGTVSLYVKISLNMMNNEINDIDLEKVLNWAVSFLWFSQSSEDFVVYIIYN